MPSGRSFQNILKLPKKKDLAPGDLELALDVDRLRNAVGEQSVVGEVDGVAVVFSPVAPCRDNVDVPINTRQGNFQKYFIY